MRDKDRPYKILVHHPGTEGPTMEYPYEDLDSAIEGLGSIALAHVKERLGIRRLFEIVSVPDPPSEVKEVKDGAVDGSS